jgi:hypothetical protein
MGWASAGDIFDPVAQALIDLRADDATKLRVLGTLIDKLRDGDWDTEDESLQQFRNDPAVTEAFHRNGCGTTITSTGRDWVDGELTYRPEGDTWTLECEVHGEIGQDDGREGHDRVIRAWFDHAHAEHGGDGKVPVWMLIAGEVNHG